LKEFKIPPETTREMDAVDVESLMKMLNVYNAISESEQSKSMKGLFGK